MLRRTQKLLVAMLTVTLAACGNGMDMSDVTDSGSSPDAMQNGDTGLTTDGDARTDVPTDVRPDGGATPALFDHCTTSETCGTGRTCYLGFPGGLCTQMCQTTAECGSNGVCHPTAHFCLPSCTFGATSCGPTQVCNFYDANDDVHGACFPACYPQGSPAGEPNCATGLVCEPGSRSPGCSSMPLRTGAPDGSPCTRDSDCRGWCIAEVSSGPTANGFIGGMCLSYGRTPAISEYVENRPMPRSNCAEGSVALPRIVNGDEGDSAYCLRSCRTDADCSAPGTPGVPRPGFGCSIQFTSDGVCIPINCRATGRTCPTGYNCVDSPAATGEGICARP